MYKPKVKFLYYESDNTGKLFLNLPTYESCAFLHLITEKTQNLVIPILKNILSYYG